MALNQRVLAALIEHDGADVSRLVHHAAQAGDLDAIVQYGPAAARDAVRAGAHREAVAHFALVLEQEDRFSVTDQAALLEEFAIECYTIGAAERRSAPSGRAVELNRPRGDARTLGASLRWLSRMPGGRGTGAAPSRPAGKRSRCWSGPGDRGCSRSR